MSDIAWLNGKIIPAENACVPVYDLGVVAGASVTEMIRTFKHRPFRVDDHLDRLEDSLAIMGFEAQFEREQLRQAIKTVVEQNSASLENNDDLGVVVFVTGGRNLTYLGAAAIAQAGHGTACVHSFRLPFDFWASKYDTGQKLATGNVAAIPINAINPQAKHRNRLHWYLADREVRSKNPGSAVLMLDSEGFVTETSAGNFFLLEGQTIRTPPAEQVLGGISQSVLKEIAEQQGFQWLSEPITVHEVSTADEAWTSSTPYCLLPVTEFNGRSIGVGTPGPAFRNLIDAWSNSVNLDIVAQAQRSG